MQSEQQYLQNYDPSAFRRPSVTVDILIFTIEDKKLKLLLIKRNMHPYMGKWAIPGGFLQMEESADEAAARRIREEAGVENVHLEQLYTFSAVNRDPRTRVISIAYLATVPFGKLKFHAGTGAEEAALFTVSGLSEESLSLTSPGGEVITGQDLAFDHSEIIRCAVQRMRGKLDYTELAFGFLEDPSAFSLSELRLIHEAILDRKLDIGNFRRTIKREYEATGRIKERSVEKGSVGRPAMLYTYQSDSEH